MNMCNFSLSRFQQADFVLPWKTKTCHGRRSWRTIHRFKDTSRFERLSKESPFQTILKEIFIRRLFFEFLWILLSSVLTPPWCKRLMWWVHYYSKGARDTNMWKSVEKCNFFSPEEKRQLRLFSRKEKSWLLWWKQVFHPVIEWVSFAGFHITPLLGNSWWF